jgi:hypothetical protein
MVKLTRRTLALFAAFACAACGGPETGMPIDSSVTSVALTATSTDEDVIAIRSESAGLSVDEVGLSLRTLEIVPCEEDAAPLAHVDYPVDLAVDPPARASFESGVDDYCSMRLDVSASTDAEPAALEGLAVHLFGVRSDDVRFEIRSALDFELVLATPSGADFGAKNLALGFDLAVWLAGIDIGEATLTDGVALVDSDANAELLAEFEANTASAVALYVDADRDGVLDADELTSIATTD